MAVWNYGSQENYEAEQAERCAVFNKIAPKENWKYPIDCWIDGKDFEECNAAAKWFTGGALEVVERGLCSGTVRVKGAGYYSNVGA